MKEGDVVRLKSGGPTMTIRHESRNQWLCVWFETINGTQTLREALFSSAMLEKVR